MPCFQNLVTVKANDSKFNEPLFLYVRLLLTINTHERYTMTRPTNEINSIQHKQHDARHNMNTQICVPFVFNVHDIVKRKKLLRRVCNTDTFQMENPV